MRRICLFLATITISIFSCITSFAGQWQSDVQGWWYVNDNGTYPNTGWNWIDGKCYYFSPDGYCLQNTQTPDGYMVDENGAWVIDGVVQTQNHPQVLDTCTIGNLTLSTPNGFWLYEQTDAIFCLFASYDQQRAIAVYCSDIGVDPRTNNYSEEYINSVIDAAMIDEGGAYNTKTYKQLSSGSWNCYGYSTAEILNGPGTLTAYVRMDGSYMQLIMIAGDLTNTDTDGLMNTLIK